MNARFLVFHDPAYPCACPDDVIAALVPGDYRIVDATGLARQLDDGANLLISFHGPYFPKDAWNAILAFLQRGGNLAIFGGMPFARPVRADGTIEPEQDAYTRQLYLGPFFAIAAHHEPLSLVAADDAACLDELPLTGPAQPGSFWAFYPKLTQAADHPGELGSSGPVDTILTPLIFARTPGGERIATPALLLDQCQGQFRGGRWLISAWQPKSASDWLANRAATSTLIRLAAAGAQMLDVRPALACYHPGEAAGLVVGARTPSSYTASIRVLAPDGSEIERFEITTAAKPVLQEIRLDLPACSVPGLYMVETVYAPTGGLALRQTTGFWIWDEALVERTRNRRLTAGRDYFYQDGKPFLVCGTTYMDSVVQRKFLLLPNPARWDRDFAEMKHAGMNLLRTGIWTAWRQFMPVAGVAAESALRALDAFVMTASKHDLQLIFTFFAFYPLAFEGDNPWLDPRSLQGQRDYLALLAGRYAKVALLSWDLINEPSFGNPQQIFTPRPFPNYDRFELAAFRDWLQQRYSLPELQLRWRVTPSELPDWEHVMPPLTAEYSTEVNDTSTHNMLKVADYTHFSQEMFSAWAAAMYDTIRAAGSQTLIGVGQDEAGARPAPQFYAPAVDYTTTHPWWKNDALVWDMLLDKTPEKPNLIQETGVMLVRDVDMRPWRSEASVADLLERKLMTGLASRGAGLIQWLWHTNPYMLSDNENSIGLVRTDGSAKPELRVIREFGRLAQAIGTRLIEPSSLPPVWVVIPYAQWFLRPALAIEPTRQAVRILSYEFGVIPQLIGDQQIAATVQAGHRPQCVFLPGIQYCNPATLKTLVKLAEGGTVVFISGVITRDQHNLVWQPPIPGFDADDSIPIPVARYEDLEGLPGGSRQLVYEGEKIGYVKKAQNALKTYRVGNGRIIWSGLPLELASSPAVTREVYRQVLTVSGFGVQPDDRRSSEQTVLVERLPLTGGSLVIVVSESSTPQHVTVDESMQVEVAPNRAGAIILSSGQPDQLFGGIQQIER